MYLPALAHLEPGRPAVLRFAEHLAGLPGQPGALPAIWQHRLRYAGCQDSADLAGRRVGRCRYPAQRGSALGENIADYLLLDGWARDYATDAIAQDYRFSIEASNTKAAVLKSLPTNLNSKYEHREISGFEVGVTGGVEVNKDGPKAKLEASAKFSQQRQLAYNTQDYRVERSAPSAQKVSFSWVRDQYATAESLLSKTATVWGKGYDVDHNRIQPLSYKGFVPNLDVIYKAAPDETGSTEFKIDSSVNIRPIYTGIYKHYYVVGHMSPSRALKIPTSADG